MGIVNREGPIVNLSSGGKCATALCRGSLSAFVMPNEVTHLANECNLRLLLY
jgi:hypothetical protein